MRKVSILVMVFVLAITLVAAPVMTEDAQANPVVAVWIMLGAMPASIVGNYLFPSHDLMRADGTGYKYGRCGAESQVSGPCTNGHTWTPEPVFHDTGSTPAQKAYYSTN